jgi:5-methyltetrahydrofolate--homocysteine methyltransferase
MESIIIEIYNNILTGQSKLVESEVLAALQSGITPKEILEEGMVNAMAEVGRLFEQGEYYIPDMLISARAMKAGMNVLKPSLKEANIASAGKIAIGTVMGDLHDIGKNLVAMMLEGAGFDIEDLGTDVNPEKFIAVADQVDVIALSALLTTTMSNMKIIVNALEAAGKRGGVKIIIGGAPVTEAYAQQIGADGFAPDASRAVLSIKALLSQKLPSNRL